MLTDKAELVSPGLLRRMDKAAATRMATAMLDGANLTIKPQARELVIVNPAEPANGQLRVDYATGVVTFRKTIWVPLGLLDGYEYDDGRPSDFGSDKILRVLCSGEKNEWRARCDRWLAEHPDLV
jgi:hypothetical protein